MNVAALDQRRDMLDDRRRVHRLLSRNPNREPALMLLGAFELQGADGDPLPLPLGTQRVVAFLALHGRRHCRAFVAGSLWPSVTDTHACASLRSALCRLSKPARELVATTATQLSLSKELVVDIDEMVTQSTRPETISSVEYAEALVSLFELQLLPDWYDDWLIESRERWRLASVRALEELAVQHSAAGRFRLGEQAGLAAVRADPLRESAHRALIGVHLSEGNLGEAVRQHAVFERLLRDELGLSPSPRMDSLMQAIMSQ